MLKAKVSVIIPFFNAYNYLNDTIQSVLHQTYDNLELLIINDGSTDDSAQIIQSFNDSRIFYFHQENRGAASARNYGLKKATGDYIQYLDSDDILHPEKIQKQLEELSSLPEDAVASCTWAKFNDYPVNSVTEHEPVWKDYANPHYWLIDSWLGGGMMQTGCWLVPRKISEKAGPWDENLSLHDDGEYFTRILLQATSIKFVEDSLVYYRQLPGSLSRVRNTKAVESAYQVTDLSVQHLLKKNNSSLAKKASARHYGRFAYEFYAQNPILSKKALDNMEKLYSLRQLNIGPPKFNLLVKLVGLRKALQIKHRIF